MIRSLALAFVLLAGRLSPLVAQSVPTDSTSTTAAQEPVAAEAAPATAPDTSPATSGAIDSLLAAATEAIARGLPYRASRMLDSVVRDSARRTPEATLLAAQAASRWGGWLEVSRLLADTAWPDERLRGPALLLAARAAVELGA
ncbi:MAG TPA: hypothetical protein VI297_04790, partial [Gemmatimonadales bacterium]